MIELEIGSRFGSELCLSVNEIVDGAKFVGDLNPLHTDEEFANDSRFASLIASGSHVSGVFSALIPTYFSQFGDILGIDMNFSFKAPILPDRIYQMTWSIVECNFNNKMNGTIFCLEGKILDTKKRIIIQSEANIILYPK